jgi:hypothetical protein
MAWRYRQIRIEGTMSDTPTHDTPQERQDKAEVLASALRRFRWETRIWYVILLVYVIVAERV